MNQHSEMKYWSWIGAFTLSVLFWGQMAWMLIN
ncbi:small membrane protein YmiC [Trabulsiella odontotermitis]|jgi:hypothetical protein|nr:MULTISPECIES: small membrane protein YmiC [Trabulsiella]WHP33285.1 small membrane protein YmiC [Trabulsiella odontotermitis]